MSFQVAAGDSCVSLGFSALRGSLVAAVCVAGLWGIAGCAPDTDLWAHSGRGEGSGEEQSGVALSSPAPNETEVPPNLAMIVLRLPSAVTETSLASASVVLRATGPEVSTHTSGVAPCAEGAASSCWSLSVESALLGGATYVASVPMPLTFADGTRVMTSHIGSFTTAVVPDDVPPMVSQQAVELAGPCLHVSLSVDEPAVASVSLTSADPNTGDPRSLTWPVGDGTGALDALVPFESLVGVVAVQARARDRAGNEGISSASLLTLPAVPTVTISEILSNPAGPEPVQEFVELHNEGEQSVDVSGFILEDGKGRDILPTASLAPGAFALVVPSGFDATAPGDVAPRLGTQLLRVDTRLGGDGLSNDRDVVRLRLPDGTLVSSYDGFTSTSASSWNGRSLHRRPGSVCDGAASWSTLPGIPTPGWQ